MERNITVFLNPAAGRGAATEADALKQAFAGAGVRAEVRTLFPHEIGRAMRAAAQEGASALAAAGGDGTISAAADALAGSETILLPVPLGTLNHFCNRYGIGSVDAAVTALARGHVSRVHVGTVNNQVFVNNASCGFYPHVVRHRDRLERVLPRVPAMWIAGLRVLAALPMMKLQIAIHGGTRELRTPALWVGIGRNSLRLPEPGDARVEGEVLEIVAGRADRRGRILALAARMLWHLRQGIEPHGADLVVERAPSFTLSARHAIDIALDGEARRMRGPLEFALRKNALRLFCLVAPDT